MSYLQNAWYAAAWSKEVGEGLLARTFLEIPVVLFRDEAGQVIALHDRCPHRFAPLSMGALVDGTLRCGYHGLSFDKSGACVKSLFSPVAPRAARIRTFTIFEQDAMVWIWMGEEEPQDTNTIPRLKHQVDPAMKCLFGLTKADADYRLLSDNLMDLTHTALMHPLFGGLNYIPEYKSWDDNGEIVSQYIINKMPAFAEGTEGFVHNHDEIRWYSPSTHYLESCVTSLDGSSDTLFIPSAHVLTPETKFTTHYFWSSATAVEMAIPDEDMMATLVQAFDHEDKPMVEAVQRRMGEAELWDMNPILLPTDAGSVRVRRRLAALIEAEQARAIEVEPTQA